MRKEKYINEIQSKRKGTGLQVVIKIMDKSGQFRNRSFGLFYLCDYPTPSVAMQAALRCRDKALQDIRTGSLAREIPTVDKCFALSLELFCDTVKTRERHRTSYTYLHRKKDLRNTPIDKVSSAMVQASINDVAAHHSADAVGKCMTIWKQIFRAAQMSDVPVADKTLQVRKPKAKVPTIKRDPHCTEEDIEAFLSALETYNGSQRSARKINRDIYFLIRIMQYLGLRPQEALALSRSDISLRDGLVFIRKSIGSTEAEKRVVVPAKTEQSMRCVPIPSALVPVLEELLEESDTDPLLCHPDGRPYDIDFLGDYMHRVRKSKKTPRVTLYMMRHNFATDLVKSTDLKTLQTLMGHESGKMSMQYAAKTDVSEMRDALENRKMS